MDHGRATQGMVYIGDSPSAVLPNGKYLLGRKTTEKMAVLDPATLKWTAVGSAGKSDFNAEEGWTLMPNGTVLTYDVKNNPNSEILRSLHKRGRARVARWQI